MDFQDSALQQASQQELLERLISNTKDIKHLENRLATLEISITKAINACQGLTELHEGFKTTMKILTLVERSAIFLIKIATAAALIYAIFKASVILALKKEL